MSSEDQRAAAPNSLHFVVGRDTEAHWIVVETHGLCGGLFRDEAAALHYAEEECQAQTGDLEIACEPIRLIFR